MTYQQIRELLDRAESGDAEALREAQQESAKMAKRANVRLGALKEKGFSTPASRRAYGYLDMEERNKFSESKRLTGAELESQLEELNRFLNEEKGSTVSEAREYLAGLDRLQDNDVIEDFESDQEKRAFLRFLSSDYWNDLKHTLGRGSSPPGSKEALRAAQDALRSGATVKQLQAAYQDFRSREIAGELEDDEDMLSVFENWAEVEL